MSHKYVQEWKDKAEQDYQAVMVLSRQKKNLLPDVICFHAQQCVEKFLKALIAKHRMRVPRSHDLEFLADQLNDVEPTLGLSKDILAELNRYAIELRYPGEAATTHEAMKAVKQATYIRKECHSRLSGS